MTVFVCCRPRCGQPTVGNTARQYVNLCAEHAVEYHEFRRQYHADVLAAIATKSARMPGQMELL